MSIAIDMTHACKERKVQYFASFRFLSPILVHCAATTVSTAIAVTEATVFVYSLQAAHAAYTLDEYSAGHNPSHIQQQPEHLKVLCNVSHMLLSRVMTQNVCPAPATLVSQLTYSLSVLNPHHNIWSAFVQHI